MRAASWAAFGLCLVFASPAAANDFVPSLNLQTGTTYTRGPGTNTDDYFIAMTPQLSYFVDGDRKQLNITYAFTGSLSQVLPNSISNRLAITTAWELSPTTRLLFGVEALQALLGNYLLVKRSAQTQLGALTSLSSSLLTLSANQGVASELSSNVRLTQLATVSRVTSLDESLQLENTFVGASLALERAWDFDALGALLNVQYARTIFPPIDSTVGTVALGPTWDHDWSTRLSTSLNVSGQIAASPDIDTGPQIGPAASASILYASTVSGVGIEYAGGIEPNLLLGTLLQSQQVTLRAFTPLSERYRVLVGTSGGFLHAKNIDLSETGNLNGSFDAVLHDAEISWEPNDWVALSLRYQFIGQSAGDGVIPTPAIVRHGLIFGVDVFATRPGPRPKAVATKFSKRADGTDPSAPSSNRGTLGGPATPPSSSGGGGGFGGGGGGGFGGPP